MIIIQKIHGEIIIESLDDLQEYGQIMEETNNKINKSKLARQFGVDRRTIDRYIKHGPKKKTRNKKSLLDDYYDVIYDTLYDTGETDIDKKRVFYYKSVLYRVLTENEMIPKCAQSSFRRYINSKPDLAAYFNGSDQKYDRKSGKPFIRFETEPGKQAQLDWKESVKLYVTDHEEPVEINVMVLLMGYSRFRVYFLTLSKTQDVLLHCLDKAFETIGGVPEELVTDNMKTVMDESRTEHRPGTVNEKFAQFAKDYGFKVRPCVAFSPQTKAYVKNSIM